MSEFITGSELYHHGVLGMKWRRHMQRMETRVSNRRARIEDKRYNKVKNIVSKKAPINKNYNKSNMLTDYYTGGKNGVRRINKYMNKGDSHNKAFVKSALVSVGKQAAVTSVLALGTYKLNSYMQTPQGIANIKRGLDIINKMR